MARKTRPIHCKIPNGFSIQKSDGVRTNYSGSLIVGSQITDSIGHRRNPRTGNYDSGGPFYTSKSYVDIPTIHAECKSNNGAHTYFGPLFCPINAGAFNVKGVGTDHRSEDTSDLDPYGTNAISACAPTNSMAALSTALGELYKDGLPSIPILRSLKNRTSVLKALGSEFLNVEFGWLPLVESAKEVAESVQKARDIINQYHRDAGRNVRREFHFPTERKVETFSSKGRAQLLASHFYSEEKGKTIPEGTITTTVETVVDRWFVGSFTYSLPSSSDAWGRLNKMGADADHLLGTDLTPNVLWELTPWSWAVDWFTNTSEVINNVTQFAQYGLIMRYGYIMEHSIKTITSRMDRAARPGAPNTPVGPSIRVLESKVRRPANPYGFEIGWEDMSPTQLLIAAAVGITRL